MTREEACRRIDDIDYCLQNRAPDYSKYDHEAMMIAKKTLEQEQIVKIEESNFSQEQYLADIQSAYDCGKSVLNKIRAEIMELDKKVFLQFLIEDVDKEVHHTYQECLKILDKYKAESEKTDE